MPNKFYRYIREKSGRYQIIKGNETYGTYSKLTDALYERDRLIRVNWDWDASMELEETENSYEKMKLPKFVHEHDYIYIVYGKYEVWKDGEYCEKFTSKIDAYEFAKQVQGEVKPMNPRYRIQKMMNGKQKSFGQYGTLEEAKKVRDKLAEEVWFNESVR